MVERAVYRSDAALITDIDFHPFHPPYEMPAIPVPEKTPSAQAATAHPDALLNRPLKDAVWELKVTLLESALRKAKYNQKKAARMLGLTYHQFRGLYRRYQAVEGR